MSEWVPLLRASIQRRIQQAVADMPKYYGTMIHASDFADDALIYALDEAVATEPVLRAEAAMLEEMAMLRTRLSQAEHENRLMDERLADVLTKGRLTEGRRAAQGFEGRRVGPSDADRA